LKNAGLSIGIHKFREVNIHGVREKIVDVYSDLRLGYLIDMMAYIYNIDGFEQFRMNIFMIKSPVTDAQIVSRLDNARTASDVQPGGIDLGDSTLDLQIKRDGNGVPLPVILEIKPATSISLFGSVAGETGTY